MIAPNMVVFSTDPQRSVTEALLKRVAKKPPKRLRVEELRPIPPAMPKISA